MGKVIGERERLLREQREAAAKPARHITTSSVPRAPRPVKIEVADDGCEKIAGAKGKRATPPRKPKPKKAPKAAKAKPARKDFSPRNARGPGVSSFDKNQYQKTYMRDKRAADKIGLTVKEYRAKPGYTAESGLPA